jgi:hypothetical protein
MSDWAVVLADPDNVRLDGPGGGLPDADAPADAALDSSTPTTTGSWSRASP